MSGRCGCEPSPPRTGLAWIFRTSRARITTLPLCWISITGALSLAEPTYVRHEGHDATFTIAQLGVALRGPSQSQVVSAECRAGAGRGGVLFSVAGRLSLDRQPFSV